MLECEVMNVSYINKHGDEERKTLQETIIVRSHLFEHMHRPVAAQYGRIVLQGTFLLARLK